MGEKLSKQKMLSIADIIIDPAFQIRVENSEETIQEYLEQLQAKVFLPSIDVFQIDKAYYLADGYHRLKAAILGKQKYLPCEVHVGTREECLMFAVGANNKHGLKRSREDKRNAIQKLDEAIPGMSSRAVAEACKVSHTFVDRFRNIPMATLPVAEVVDGEDPESVENVTLPEVPPTRTGLDGRKRKVKPSTAPTSQAGDKDKVGWPIPEPILPLWNRSGEAKKLISAVSDVKHALTKAKEVSDPLFAEIHFYSVIAHLDNALLSLKTAMPYAVCPTCKGKLTTTCVLCKGRGFISKFKWDTVVPQEQKDLMVRLKK